MNLWDTLHHRTSTTQRGAGPRAQSGRAAGDVPAAAGELVPAAGHAAADDGPPRRRLPPLPPLPVAPPRPSPPVVDGGWFLLCGKRNGRIGRSDARLARVLFFSLEFPEKL